MSGSAPRVTDSIVLTHMVRKPSRFNTSHRVQNSKPEPTTSATNAHGARRDNHSAPANKQEQPQHVDIVLQSRNIREQDSEKQARNLDREEQAKKDREFLQRIGANPSFPVHLDYSFRDLKRLDDVAAEQARQPPAQATRDPNNLYENVTGIRINNNQLEKLDGMFKALGRVVSRPLELTYLDLSFNKIRALDKSILEFRELAHLNLHGNRIDSWDSLEQLDQLRQLKQLTLHGNLLEQSAQARYIDTAIGLFPTIEKIDFTLITREDRERSSLWIVGWRKARRRQRKMAHAAEAAAMKQV